MLHRGVSFCLLNIDLVQDCLRHLAASDIDRVIAGTNEVAALFRGAGLPVVWVRQEFAPDLSDAFQEMRKHSIRAYLAGTPGAQLDPRLEVDKSDLVLVKKRYSAFYGTELESTLRKHEVDALVLTGANTHACVRTTAIDAYQRDLDVILASECLASYDEEHARISMDYMDGKIGRSLMNSEIHALIAVSAPNVR